MEPHPLSPDPSPYKGSVWELDYSTLRQPQTYDERLANAKLTAAGIPALRVLVDDLSPRNATAGSMPFWCTYGPNPNGAWLIAPNGTVVLGQTWFEYEEMRAAFVSLLSLS